MSKALVIVGHGSSMNPETSLPIKRAAAEINRRGVFDEVAIGFLKQEPFIGQVLDGVDADHISIVPFFISDGYYTQEVIPREMGLDGPLTERDGKTIVYTEPIGSDPLFAELIVQRALEITEGDVSEVSLAVLGHGTGRNPDSEKNVFLQSERIASMMRFKEVLTVFIDQEPHLQNIFEMSECNEIVLVPLFVADGWHVTETIPEEMGMIDGVLEKGEKRLFYAKAVGTDPGVVQLILKMACERG